jgi:cysteine-rich repeat protein
MSIHSVCVVCTALLLFSGCGRLGYPENASTFRDGGMDATPDAADAADASEDATRGPDTAVAPVLPVCGDGEVNGEDECDDGNGTSGDGCENDCTFSCTADVECADENLCNGDELCADDTRACVPGADVDDGTPCLGALAEANACRGGSCAPTTCGDGLLDVGEDCEDRNLGTGDGCENDCTFSCVEETDCDDGESCTRDFCTLNVCESVTSVDATLCDRDMDDMTRDLCIGGTCVPSLCGDGFHDMPVEACDDGNRIAGDGCEADCTFTCLGDRDCSDLNPCNGDEICDLVTHTCGAGPPPPPDTPCLGGTCASGFCIPTSEDAGTGEGCGGGVCARGTFCCGACGGVGGSCIPTGFSCMDVCPDGGIKA